MTSNKLAGIILIVVISTSSCNNKDGYNYAIKDFRKPLQPFLTEIVSRGIIKHYDSVLRFMATDKELLQLSQSEHPALRAAAFRELFEKKSFNHFELLMNHLEDKAMVIEDMGEFGYKFLTVSDYILLKATWKNEQEKNKTIDAVITKHNYLAAAYEILEQIEPQEKYYPFIKKMAERKYEYYEVGGFVHNTENIAYALYGLAKFKKKEDIKLIKEQLLYYYPELNENCFRLMKEFPDTAYMQVYEAYYPRRFYKTICREKDVDKATDFINSIAGYKNERSANILDSILNRKPFINCEGDVSRLKKAVNWAIWNNDCKAYNKLRKQIEKKISEYKKYITEFEVDTSHLIPKDTSTQPLRWR